MPTPLSAEIQQLIDRPNFAHLATLMPDGSPSSTPVWVGREGDRVLVCTSDGSLKGRNTRRDPRGRVARGGRDRQPAHDRRDPALAAG